MRIKTKIEPQITLYQWTDRNAKDVFQVRCQVEGRSTARNCDTLEEARNIKRESNNNLLKKKPQAHPELLKELKRLKKGEFTIYKNPLLLEKHVDSFIRQNKSLNRSDYVILYRMGKHYILKVK